MLGKTADNGHADQVVDTTDADVSALEGLVVDLVRKDAPIQSPPLGFNSWNFYHCNIDENEIKVRCAFSTEVYTRGCHWFPRLLA
jgi:hypothetical protein